MNTENVGSRLALGAAAGLAGTLALQILLKTRQKWLPESLPPMREEPGKFMVRKVAQALPRKMTEPVSEQARALGGKLLGMGYGMTFGVLYALARPRTKRAIVEGTLLGILSWATGYLGWLPGAKLMSPVWRQKWHQAVLPIAEHALFGVATVAGHRWLKERTAA